MTLSYARRAPSCHASVLTRGIGCGRGTLSHVALRARRNCDS